MSAILSRPQCVITLDPNDALQRHWFFAIDALGGGLALVGAKLWPTPSLIMLIRPSIIDFNEINIIVVNIFRPFDSYVSANWGGIGFSNSSATVRRQANA